MVAALRRLGFDGVYDTDFAADLTIMKRPMIFGSGKERRDSASDYLLFTGWIKFCEHMYPECIPNLSSCKSPQQMFGSIAKTWYAQKEGIDPKDLVVVSVMPCTAKKFEITRDDMSAAGNGIPDTDIALTTRELARMINRAGIQFTELPDEEFDAPLASPPAPPLFSVQPAVLWKRLCVPLWKPSPARNCPA